MKEVREFILSVTRDKGIVHEAELTFGLGFGCLHNLSLKVFHLENDNDGAEWTMMAK